jgi:hypothetical protein
MAGASSSAKARALFSEAAEAIIASATAWSLEEGVGAPMVCQAEDLALRNSEVWPETVEQVRFGR